MKSIRVNQKDVQPGDWADHKSRTLDPREVVEVNRKQGTMKIKLITQAIDVPLANYTFSRDVP